MTQSLIRGFNEQLSTDIDPSGRHSLKVWQSGSDVVRSAAHIVAAATTNPTVVKAAAGAFHGCVLANTAAAWRFVKLHNGPSAPTAGAGVVRTLPIAPGGVLVIDLSAPIAFPAGIGLTIVSGAADTDATAVAANDVVGEILFV